MNAVMKLKKKYSCPRNAEICDIINEYISTTDSSIEENETRLSEDRRKIEELSRDLVVVKNKLQTEKLIVNNKTKDLKSENEKLKSLEIEKNRMAKNNYIQERQCHKLRTRKPSSKDQTILNLGQRKLDLCKQLTRIRWDYGAMDVAIKGFVTDKKNYICAFRYSKDIGKEELSDLLWKEIQLSTVKKFDNEADKENSTSNKGSNF